MTARGHADLHDEQGIASAVDATGSGPKTATDHTENDPGETGSGPRTATDLAESESEPNMTGSGLKTATARGRTATETRPATDALDCFTASGKQSEIENDGTGHESWPTESGPYDPSLFLDPKIGKHGRIENGSGPPKTPRLTTSQSVL